MSNDNTPSYVEEICLIDKHEGRNSTVIVMNNSLQLMLPMTKNKCQGIIYIELHKKHNFIMLSNYEFVAAFPF